MPIAHNAIAYGIRLFHIARESNDTAATGNSLHPLRKIHDPGNMPKMVEIPKQTNRLTTPPPIDTPAASESATKVGFGSDWAGCTKDS